MYSDWVGPAIAGFLALWLGILTFFIRQQNNFLKALFPRSGERDIRKKFEEVLSGIEIFKQDLQRLKGKLSEVEEDGLKHIQRVKLLRYNPYNETGGDQSFTLTMLDNKGNGFVLTSLHARSGTRVFAKPVNEEKNSKYQFSEEEKKSIEQAMKI